VASKTKSPIEVTKIVGAHFYDGRTTTKVADAEHLERERDFEMALISAGIIPHYLPVSEKLRVGADPDTQAYKLAQKGVDVQLALDVLDFAHEDRFDVAVLITGDGDFVPLVRKITSIGKQALIAYFQIEQWVDSRKCTHNPTYASPFLINAASYSLNFNALMKDADWKIETKALFFQPAE
jgi:uncharacterized LabA/DUF88 family protein